MRLLSEFEYHCTAFMLLPLSERIIRLLETTVSPSSHNVGCNGYSPHSSSSSIVLSMTTSVNSDGSPEIGDPGHANAMRGSHSSTTHWRVKPRGVAHWSTPTIAVKREGGRKSGMSCAIDKLVSSSSHSIISAKCVKCDNCLTASRISRVVQNACTSYD